MCILEHSKFQITHKVVGQKQRHKKTKTAREAKKPDINYIRFRIKKQRKNLQPKFSSNSISNFPTLPCKQPNFLQFATTQ